LLTSRLIGRSLRVYEEVTSTNDLAIQEGRNGAPEGLVIFAEAQMKGRGRLGRAWQTDGGKSLAFSILLRPTWTQVSRISLVAAVAVTEALQPLTTFPVGIKWPNDIYLGGRKIAGILCEAGSDFIVIGIGINVLQQEHDFDQTLSRRAGSIAMFSHPSVDRTHLAAAVLNRFDKIYADLPEAFDHVIDACERRSVLLGKHVRIAFGQGDVAGVVTGLDRSGALKVRDDSENEMVIHAGEVTFLEVPG